MFQFSLYHIFVDAIASGLLSSSETKTSKLLKLLYTDLIICRSTGRDMYFPINNQSVLSPLRFLFLLYCSHFPFFLYLPFFLSFFVCFVKNLGRI